MRTLACLAAIVLSGCSETQPHASPITTVETTADPAIRRRRQPHHNHDRPDDHAARQR